MLPLRPQAGYGCSGPTPDPVGGNRKHVRLGVCWVSVPGSETDKSNCVATGMSLPWIDVLPRGRKLYRSFLGGGKLREKREGARSLVSAQSQGSSAPPMPASPCGKVCFPLTSPFSFPIRNGWRPRAQSQARKMSAMI